MDKKQLVKDLLKVAELTGISLYPAHTYPQWWVQDLKDLVEEFICEIKEETSKELEEKLKDFGELEERTIGQRQALWSTALQRELNFREAHEVLTLKERFEKRLEHYLIIVCAATELLMRDKLAQRRFRQIHRDLCIFLNMKLCKRR